MTLDNNKPTMFIFAGSNGAGKSTFYTSIKDSKIERTDNKILLNSIRINADEILRAEGGDWRKDSDNLKALLKEVRMINKNIKEKKSFNFETTLAATEKTYLKYIESARDKGFHVVLIYVGLTSSELAISRVKARVLKGGHGIKDDLIVKRYNKSLGHLSKLVNQFDEVRLYDNSEKFVEVYERIGNKINIKRLGYSWAKEAIEADSKGH